MQSVTRRKTDPIVRTPEQIHSSPDRSDITHLTHSSGTATPPDFVIKLPIKTPKAGDKSVWNDINVALEMHMEVNPVYKQGDLPSIKFSKLSAFIYSFFETEYGCKEPKAKKVNKMQDRNAEKKKLRRLKRELKREWKKNPENNCDLKKRFFKVTKLLNILRKQNVEAEKAADFQKQTNSFRKNPHKFAKNLFNSKDNPTPKFASQEAYDFFSKTCCDSTRGMNYKHPPGLMIPEIPKFPFKMDPPSDEEIKLSLKRKRNGAAPGPNGIPYLVYKKLPILQYHLSLILQEMWPNFEMPQSRYGITGLIHKSGSTDIVSNYRPVTMTNTDGKILLSILAARSLSYMKSNGYFDLSVQKGFINDMAGCAEHTTMLSELLKNAKQNNRQITVCWTDLENAFGSLRHDLIQFALSWYHFPEDLRNFVHDYYEGLSIKIRTSMWTTEPVALLMGIFQGCPLSVQLFNIVWNIALDMVESSPARGYIMKEAGIEKRQLSYVDDHTVITSSPEDAQCILNTLDVYFSWTACVRAKPPKCRSLAFRVFRKGSNDNYKASSERRYSAYDPKLLISGKAIPFLGDEPFKFLGRKITSKKDDLRRAEIKESLVANLMKTDRTNITGPMKLWLYNNFVVAFITWSFMIYDLPISYGEELKTVATKYLKDWMGITKTITNSVLYRSKDHFGLGLTDLVTHLKKMQVCRMHIHKYSQDRSSKELYEYMKERDKPCVNGLGIPVNPRIWKPTNALEKAERDIHLDTIAFCHQPSKMGAKPTVKSKRQNILRRIERDDEEMRLAKCYSYVTQGDWLNFDAVLKADLSWNSLIYTIPQELLKFLLNSTHNVLPTPDNLRRWGKTVVDIKCNLCSYSNPTLKHILNGCSMALKQGRYTWRHDNVLHCIAKQLESFLDKVNSRATPNSSIKDTFINFVKEGERPKKGKVTYKSGLLSAANDWILAYDNISNPLVFPHHIAQTSLRPDIVIYSNTTKQVILLELTVPAEDNIIQRHMDKENKYAKLLDDISMKQWRGHIYGIEVGSRGYVAKSFGFALRKLGFTQNAIRNAVKDVSLVCLRSSYSIYLSRKNEIWRAWEEKHPLIRIRNDSFRAEENPQKSVYTEEEDFCGFEEMEIKKAKKENKRKCCILRGEEDINTFQGFKITEIEIARCKNQERAALLRGVQNRMVSMPLVPNKLSQKTPGLKNLGNTCYMNSIVQCLNYANPLVKYFTEDAYCRDLNPMSKFCGTIAKEIGALFSTLNSGNCSPVSLQNLKTAVGNFHHPFQGSGQHDSHEFLMFLLNWLHEDLKGVLMSVTGNHDDIPDYLIAETIQRECFNNGQSVISSLFQGEHRHKIICNKCLHESISFESFTILSLSLPTSGGSTLADLLQCYYEDSSVDYRCLECEILGKNIRKTEIWKVPPMLILHFNRFEYNISARKKQNYISFPLEELSLVEYTAKDDNILAYYNLYGVSNHYGTLDGGHYTSFCKPRDEKIWYKFDDQMVTKLTVPVNSSAAYLLFYESAHIDSMTLT